MDAINKHRSIRKYKDKPIADVLLNKILMAGTRASTTGNMQVYSIIVTQDNAIKKHLLNAHFNQKMVLQAPVVLTFCADFNRFSKWCRQNNADPGYNNFLSFFTAAIDALLAAQNCVLEAESNGLGICYLGTTTYMADTIIDILKLPKLVVPVTTVVVGYPDENPELSDRLPLDAIIHKETYADYSSDRIDDLFAAKEAMELYKGFVKEHNKQSLAQVFTDVRYTKKDNEFFSKAFFEVIKKQGFFNQ